MRSSNLQSILIYTCSAQLKFFNICSFNTLIEDNQTEITFLYDDYARIKDCIPSYLEVLVQ